MARINTRSQTKKAAKPSESTAATTTKPNGHVRFDSDDDEEEEVVANGVNLSPEAAEKVGEVNGKEEKEVGSEDQDDDEDDDDDAPETVTLTSGRESAKAKENEARKAVEAQAEAAKQKRKRREAVLKEQKEKSSKRRKIAAQEDADEEDESPKNDKPTPTTTKTIPLLPADLLEKFSSRPSPPPASSRKNKRTTANDDDDELLFDFYSEDEDNNRALKKNNPTKTKLPRKATPRTTFNKGAVRVKVLKEDSKAKRAAAPPASKRMVHVKNSWKAGRGRVGRRPAKIGGWGA